MKYKQWNRACFDPRARGLMEAAGVPPLAALALCARGLDTVEKARTFLSSDPALLEDPMLLRDMDRAVDRIDRRNTYVMLTPAGEAARADTIRELDGYTRRVLERMGREDMETLIRLWNRLADVMTEERAKENTP